MNPTKCYYETPLRRTLQRSALFRQCAGLLLNPCVNIKGVHINSIQLLHRGRQFHLVIV
jgi:hypothetical protein